MSKKILVIEDQEDNRRIMNDTLTAAGFEVIEAVTGEAGVALADSHRPDLILMDIQLPGLDGYEATRQLRQAGYERPIIALTAHAMEGHRESCLEAGCDDFATKPIDRTRLVAVVRKHLGEREQHTPFKSAFVATE